VIVMKEGLTKRENSRMMPLLAGGVVGAGLALLLAPKPGNEVRKDIKRFATSTRDRVSLAIDKGKDLYGEGAKAVANAIKAGKTAFIQEKEKWQHAS
jgi:gas vesicle protein